jgi:hypothetical protein
MHATGRSAPVVSRSSFAFGDVSRPSEVHDIVDDMHDPHDIVSARTRTVSSRTLGNSCTMTNKYTRDVSFYWVARQLGGPGSMLCSLCSVPCALCLAPRGVCCLLRLRLRLSLGSTRPISFLLSCLYKQQICTCALSSRTMAPDLLRLCPGRFQRP